MKTHAQGLYLDLVPDVRGQGRADSSVHHERDHEPGKSCLLHAPLLRPGRSYWMTLSARSRLDRDTCRPSRLAVLRLTTNSIRSGSSTGISAGGVPVRILWASRAAWRPCAYWS